MTVGGKLQHDRRAVIGFWLAAAGRAIGSSAVTSAVLAAPIRWKISSACRSGISALGGAPVRNETAAEAERLGFMPGRGELARYR